MNLQQLINSEINFSSHTLETDKKGNVVVTQRIPGKKEEETAKLIDALTIIGKGISEHPLEFEDSHTFKRLRQLGDRLVETLDHTDDEKETLVQKKIQEIVQYVLLSKWSHSDSTLKKVIAESCVGDPHWQSIFFESHFLGRDLASTETSPLFIIGNTLGIDTQFFDKEELRNSEISKKNEIRLQEIQKILRENPGISSLCLQNGFFTPCKLPQDEQRVMQLLREFLNTQTRGYPFLLAEGKNSSCTIHLSPALIEKSRVLSEMVTLAEENIPFENNLLLKDVDENILVLLNAHAPSNFKSLNELDDFTLLPDLLKAADYLNIPELRQQCVELAALLDPSIYFSQLLSLAEELDMPELMEACDRMFCTLLDRHFSQEVSVNLDVVDRTTILSHFPISNKFLSDYLTETFSKDRTNSEELEFRLKRFEESGLKLQTLELHFSPQTSQMTDQHFVRILKTSPDLRLLKLQNAHLTQAVMPAIQRLSKLDTVDFFFVGALAGDALIESLSKLPLRNLVLCGQFSLSDATAQSLPRFTQLKFLSLSPTGLTFTPKAFSQLAKLTQLEILRLDNIEAESIGPYLASLQGLKALELWMAYPRNEAENLLSEVSKLPQLEYFICRDVATILNEQPDHPIKKKYREQIADNKNLERYCSALVKEHYPEF